MIQFHALPVGLSLTFGVVTMLHLFSCVHSLHMTRRDQTDPALYSQLHAALSQALLQDMALSQNPLPDPADPSLPYLPLPAALSEHPRAPTDTPTLTELMRSALLAGSQRGSPRLRRPAHRQHSPIFTGSQFSRPLLPQGRPLSRAAEGLPAVAEKRSFDSISRSSSFGMSRGGWGGGGRYGGDNLSFTFESLFPVIARRLRSI